MYLWVVIATFIAILYSYNVSVRADFDRVHAETKAGVVIAKFRAQHNAVKDYFNSRATDKIGQQYVDYYPGYGKNISDSTKEISASVADFLPVGFKEDNEVVSKVFCLEEGDLSSPQCTSGEGSCCSYENMGVYVVSFRQMPNRWRNKVTLMPNADLLGSMTKVRGFGKTFGYVDKIGSDLVLSGGRLVYEVDGEGERTGDAEFGYQKIFDAVKNDADFKAKGCDQEDAHCLYAIQQIYS